jgi:hypothetical protein
MDESSIWKELAIKAAQARHRRDEFIHNSSSLSGASFILERPIFGKILILPRYSAEQFRFDKPWACISCTGWVDRDADINDENRIGLLRLIFEDLDAVPGPEWSAAHPEKAGRVFTPEQGKEIWNFVEKIWDNIDLLMIHCHAGASRSPAVGKAITEVYDDPKWLRFYDSIYMPNKLVYETLISTFSKN